MGEVPGRLLGQVGPGAALRSLGQTEFLFGLAAKRPLVQAGLVSLETESSRQTVVGEGVHTR